MIKFELSKENAATLERCLAFTIDVVNSQECECGKDDCGIVATQEQVTSDVGELIFALKLCGFEFAMLQVEAVELSGDVDLHKAPEVKQ